MPGSAFDRIPAGYELYAATLALWRRPGQEWGASPINQLRLRHPQPEGLAARPRNLRPADPDAGPRHGSVPDGGFDGHDVHGNVRRRRGWNRRRRRPGVVGVQ